MNTETINTQLYEKMFAEQERYRDWLLHQPPEEILNHTYEYTTREDILMTLEDNDLSFEQAWALLSSPTPLADVFKEFENRETDYMDVVKESMASRANTVIDRHQAPLYLHDAAYAVAHNEMEHYTASLRISAACKNMIEDAIAAAYQDNSLKDVREASKAVIDTFGFDRTMFVLANTIRIKNYDGRISPENKTWAQTIPICEDQLNILVDRCNPGLLDRLQIRCARISRQNNSAASKKSPFGKSCMVHLPAPPNGLHLQREIGMPDEKAPPHHSADVLCDAGGT